MTVVSALSPISLTQFFYASGKLVRPTRLYFYKPSTEDRVTVYSDPTLNVAHDQPVLSGGSGRVPPIYIGTEPYRVRIFDSYGALVEDIDYLPGATVPGGGEGGSVLTPEERQQLLQTGDFVIQFANSGARPGFVRANGGLIGPGGFTGSGYPDIERQNDDTYDLFVWLWGQDALAPNQVLEVVPSKGSDADSDWFSLSKLIRLPDLRGRTLVGLDTMGMAAAGRLAGVAITPATGSTTKPGSYGGTATAVMTVAQMPVHAHGLGAVATGISIVGAPTGITIAPSAINIHGNYTGIWTGYAYTGQTVAANYTGIWTGAVGTGTYINDPGHSHSVTTFGAPSDYIYGFTSTGDGNWLSRTTTHNTTGVSIVDPTHAHPIGDPSHTHGLNDPQHVHPIGDPSHTHGNDAHAHGVSDPWHVHGVTDPTHTHTITAAGSSAPMPTISPFSLATFYIKL